MDSLNILILNNHLFNFAGSEIHCLELSQHLRAAGHSVTLSAAILGEPLTAEAARLGIPVVSLSSLAPGRNWDIVWTHHVPVFAHVHTRLRLRARAFLHGLLSSVLLMERPPLPASLVLEGQDLTFLANSELTRDAALPDMPPNARMSILHNFAPGEWRAAVRRVHRPALQAVACVSNHPPDEVVALQALARAKGMIFDIFTAMGPEHPRRIDPQTLAPYDAVVSIGKTVNYGLTTGIPVFVYDHFAGPGWLTDANLEAAEATIFSGKCTRRKRSAAALLAEMEAGYPAAAAFAARRTDWAAQRYGIAEQIGRLGLLDRLDKRPVALLPGVMSRWRVRRHAARILAMKQPPLA